MLAILVACIWRIVSVRPRDTDAMGEHRALLEALPDLDEDHEASKIGELDYPDQRAFLKAAILAALRNPEVATEAAADRPA